MRANGEEPSKLAALDESSAFWTITWSPDSQRVAALRFHQAPDKVELSIESLNHKGGQATLIVSDPRIQDFSWLPDARVIYSKAEPPPNDTDSNLWEIRVDGRTGQAIEKPKRVTNWAGFQLFNLSRTADGKRLAFQKATFHQNVYVGEVQNGGTRLKTPRRLTMGEYDNFPTDWTRDGKAVIFGSFRDGRREVLKQALDQDSADILVTDGDSRHIIYGPRVSPDGGWVLYATVASLENLGPVTPVNLMRVPLSGGAPQLVLTTRGFTDFGCGRSPATLCFLAEKSPDNRKLTFTTFDPVAGQRREVMKIETDPTGAYSSALSRDGSRVAVAKYFEREGRIRVLPLDGGAAHDVVTKGLGTLNSLDWAADGKGFFCSSQSPQGSRLLHIDLSGNAQVLWVQKGNIFNIFPAWGVASPDGKNLAILGTSTESNVWMIENF